MPRRTAALAVIVLGVALTMLTGAPDALACSCAPVRFAAQAEHSDVVFTGQAVERREEPPGPVASSTDPVTWIFRVEQVHKGGAADPQPVVSARSEASCGTEFEMGATYLVLAQREPDGALSTGLCQGTRSVAPQPVVPQPVVPQPVVPQPVPGVAVGAAEAPRAPSPVGEPAVPDPWRLPLVVGLGALVGGGAAGGALRRRRQRRS